MGRTHMVHLSSDFQRILWKMSTNVIPNLIFLYVGVDVFYPKRAIISIKTLPMIFFLMESVAHSQPLKKSEITPLIQGVDWSEVTFGFEAEARDQDTGRDDVKNMSERWRNGEGPKLPGESESYILNIGKESTGNLEFKSKVLSRDQIYKAMRHIRSELSQGDRPGVRGFHLHVRFPKAAIAGLSEENLKALLTRFGDATMAVRLKDYKPFFTFNTATVSRATVLKFAPNSRYIIRFNPGKGEVARDQVDIEFRGFIRSLTAMERIVDRFFVAVQNPDLYMSTLAFQGAIAKSPMELLLTLVHWASREGKSLAQTAKFSERIWAVQNSINRSSQNLLPLIPFEIFPWVDADIREKLIAERKKFLQKTYDLLTVSDKPPKDRFRRLIKDWASNVNFTELTEKSLLVRPPADGFWPKETITPALIKYLVSENALEEYTKPLVKLFKPEDLGAALRGIVTSSQATEIGRLYESEMGEKFSRALGSEFASGCETLTPYLY